MGREHALDRLRVRLHNIVIMPILINQVQHSPGLTVTTHNKLRLTPQSLS